MKIKLKKEVLELGGLDSSGSHQGFNTSNWRALNNGETVEVDKIPDRSKDKVEEVKVSSPKPSSRKKQEVKDGK